MEPPEIFLLLLPVAIAIHRTFISSMLSRRHYRIKVFQALYAWFQGGEIRQEVSEKNLLHSIEKLYELYYIQVSFLIEVHDFIRRRTEDAKNKFYPTEEERNPNTKFLDNRLIALLQANKELNSRIARYKISWTEEQEMIRKVALRIRNSKDLKSYLESNESSFEEDREIVYRIFKKYIAKSTELQFFCEERSIFWYDDYQSAALFILKTIRMIPENFGEKDVLTDLFVRDEEEDPREDNKFILELFRKSILHSDELETMIDGKTQNWELERIALTDIILIKMALTELMHFPFIPVKVTLNEYIELSKLFSTPKSKMFINGLLDKMSSELTEAKKIKKKGRGLI